MLLQSPQVKRELLEEKSLCEKFLALFFLPLPKRGPRAAKAAMATGFKAVEKKADTDHIL